MFLAHFHVRRHFFQTDLHAVLTAGSERTSLRWIQHINWCSLNRNQTFIALGINTRHRTKKTFCIWMSRLIENIIHRPLLYNLTCIHYRYLITDVCNNAKIVRNKNYSHSCFLLKILHQIQDLSLNGNIKCCGRLICDQQLRMTDQSHSNHYTLTHTAGKLMRILLHTLLYIVDSYQLHHFHGTLLCFFCTDFFIMGTKSLNQLVSNRVNRIQAGHWILKNHRYFISAKCSHFIF